MGHEAFFNMSELAPVGQRDLHSSSLTPKTDPGSVTFSRTALGTCIYRYGRNTTAATVAQGALQTRVHVNQVPVGLTVGAAVGTTKRATLSAQTITVADEHVGSIAIANKASSAIVGEWSIIKKHTVDNPNVVDFEDHVL